MASPTVRGFLVGGVFGIILHLIFRFLIRNFVWLALALVLLWVIVKFSPENPQAASKRAILNSFDPTSIMVSNAKGITASYSSDIAAISATIHNMSKARIFDVWLTCSFKPSLPSGPSKTEPQWDTARVRTNYHFGYIAPGEMVDVRVIPEADGYLREADPNSFACLANFGVERSDLLKEQP